MKIVLSLLMTTLFLFSSNLSRLYKFYENQEYDKACDYANKYYYKKRNKNSENYLTFYGLACLETNNIARIAIPMTGLTKTEDARTNASYFGTILLQKELLLQALMDKKSLGDLHLPTTNFIISKIFDRYIEKKYTIEKSKYIFRDKDLRYSLYLKKSRKNRQYMVIDVYKDDKFTKRYQYR